MSFPERLARLERSSGRPCSGCGLRPGERGYLAVSGLVERDDGPADLPATCPMCGRETRTVIRAEYEPDAASVGGGW